MSPLERRMRGLKDIMNMKRPTSNSMPYSEWPDGTYPEIIWESEDTKMIYDIL
jgi:hypothetical protein